MAGTLREELASLKIDRPDPEFSRNHGRRKSSGGGRGGRSIMRLLSLMLWLIPLGLVGAAGLFAYRQYDQIRSRPQVTVGLVQRMTTGEAEKLLTAKGYLKSRYQALIGTKLPGRVEKMCVEEGMKVKKGDTLAVLEHNDLKAMLAAREAQTARTAAELEEARADLWEKEREHRRASRLFGRRARPRRKQRRPCPRKRWRQPGSRRSKPGSSS